MPKHVSTDDRLAIQELIAKYAHYVDNGLGKAWASLFTPDGTLDYLDTHVEGYDQLVAFAEQALAFYPTHFAGNTIMVETAPGQVHARTMNIVCARSKQATVLEIMGVPVDAPADAPTEVRGVGIYDDRIIRTEQGWRFRSRAAGSTGVMPLHPDFLP